MVSVLAVNMFPAPNWLEAAQVDRQRFAPKTHEVVKPTFLKISANILIKQVLHLPYRIKIQGILGGLTFDGVFGDPSKTRFLLLARA